MRRWRAALTGDASAYEDENERMVAQFKAAVAFAVQVALAAVLPGFGSGIVALVGSAGLSIAATVATNVALYGDAYDWAHFSADVEDGLLGAAGGKLGEELAGKIATKVARSSAKDVAAAAEAASIPTALGRELETGTAVAWARAGGGYLGASGAIALGAGENPFSAEGIAQLPLAMLLGRLIARRRPPRAAPHDEAPSAPRARPTHEPPEARPTHEYSEPHAATEEEFEEGPTREFGGEPTGEHQFDEEPTGEHVRPPGPGDPTDNPLDGYRTYKRWVAADRTREVALIYNFQLDLWVPVQGTTGRVPVTRALEQLGWRAEDTTLEWHSHPVTEGGATSDPNLLPSGIQSDLRLAQQDAAKREGRQLSSIDVVTERGPDTTRVFYDQAKRTWLVDYPEPGPVPRRDRRSFDSFREYHEWFMERFGFEPGGRRILGARDPGAPAPPPMPVRAVTYATAPDVIPPGEILDFPGGARVWRNPIDNTIVVESTLGPGSGRRGFERELPSRTEYSAADIQAWAMERAHSQGQGTAFEAPYGIRLAARMINQGFQRAGIEGFGRRLAAAEPATTFRMTTATKTQELTLRLEWIDYKIEVVRNGSARELFEFRMKAEGAEGMPEIDRDSVLATGDEELQRYFELPEMDDLNRELREMVDEGRARLGLPPRPR